MTEVIVEQVLATQGMLKINLYIYIYIYFFLVLLFCLFFKVVKLVGEGSFVKGAYPSSVERLMHRYLQILTFQHHGALIEMAA